MTTLKEYYKGDMPCKDCVHKNVCNVKKCFEETKFETTHPFVDIQIKCTEYRYYGGVKKVDENKLYRECVNPND
jgi:hypothetical protein